MKRNFLFKGMKFGLISTLFCVSLIFAQQPAPQAAMRFANASAIPGKVTLTKDSRSLRPGGFAPGEYTSSFGTPAGSHRFGVSSVGAKSFETSFVLQANTATTILAFTKSVLDPQTRQTVQLLQLFSQADPPRDRGKHFFLLYVSPQPAVDLVVNGHPKNLPALKEIEADDIAHGSIKVERSGKEVLSFAAQQSGNFVAIIFDKSDGNIGGMLLPDYD